MPITRNELKVPWWSDEVMYWLEDQVIVVFQSRLSMYAGDQPPSKNEILASLNLDNLGQFLKVRGLQLQSFTSSDVPHSQEERILHPHQEEIEELEREIEGLEDEIEELGKLYLRRSGRGGYKSPRQRELAELEARVAELEKEIEKLDLADQASNGTGGGFSRRSRPLTNLNSTVGKYLFSPPDGEGTVVVGCFNIKPIPTFHPTQDITTMNALRRDGEAQCCETDSPTRKVVDLINGNLAKLKQEAKVPVIAASPNWLGGANCYGHGCPVFPPFPVPEKDACDTDSGRWPITIPALLSETSPLKDKTGKDVTVFVLDSMPDLKHNPSVIQDAAVRAGSRNKLLQEIADQQDRALSPFIKFHYHDLPAQIKEDAADQIVTGRDICGRHYGFNMPDHGLFVTGIIRDLASEADIEYVRVLNDFGICSVAGLIQALAEIQSRMAPPTAVSKAGDLYHKPVVINLSLVVTPSDEDLLQTWYGMAPPMVSSYMDMNKDSSQMQKLSAETKYDIKLLRSHLHRVIQNLAKSGAVIVASAGNDSNWPDMPGRMHPRYPAAFPEAIAVGAVDNGDHAAKYSNYPQLSPHTNGIATYGGSIPTLAKIKADTDIDAVRGVYSDIYYPAPEAENPPLPEYDPHDPTGWAYWSGTSFATPIISAVAARVLQSQQGVWMANEFVPGVHGAITTAEGQVQYVTGNAPLPLQPDFGHGVYMLKAYQCVDGATGEGQATGEEMGVAMEDVGVPD